MDSNGYLTTIINILNNIGSPVKLFIGNLLLYPTARFIYPHIHSPEVINTINIIVGILFMYIIFGFDVLYALSFCFISYFIVDLKPQYSFPIALIMNSLIQLKVRLVPVAKWSLEVAGSTMIMFQKVISLTNNLEAGRKMKNNQEIKRSFERRLAVKEKPSIFRFIGYLCNPFGSSCGPSIEYKLYEYTLFSGKRPPLDPKSRCAFEAKKKWFTSFISAGLTMLMSTFVNIDFYSKPFYTSQNLLVRIILVLVMVPAQLIRFMSVWESVEAAHYQFGLGECELVEDFYDCSNKELYSCIF